MKIHEIESVKNPIFKKFQSLLKGAGISEHNQALIFGTKAIDEILRDQSDQVFGAIVPQIWEAKPGYQVDQVYRLKDSVFKELDLFGIGEPILIVKVPEFKKVDKKLSGCSLLLLLQDPGNLGALLRSAAAFGVNQVILGPGCVHPFHPKSSRAASGSLFFHDFYQINDLEELKNSELPVLALDINGESLARYKFHENFILMPGQEGRGLLADQKNIVTDTVSIPQRGNVESLNAMVATSIALYAWSLGVPGTFSVSSESET